MTSLAQSLAANLKGAVVAPSDPGYDETRALFNAAINKRPALIARCAVAADVAAAVSFARREGLDVAVRGGAHSGPGFGSVDDGLVVDLRDLRGVEVDATTRTARVQGGTLLGEVDAATHEYGLAAPFGIISTTGVGGLTLGGGIGNLTRTLGLSIDNLVEADVVLADASSVTVNENQHDDLFWALRGGGGNFGVVTSFTFRLSPLSTVIAGPMFWPLERAEEVLSWYADFMPEQPDVLNGWFAFLTVPPADPFPHELQLQKVCGIVWCYTGADATEALRLLDPARKLNPVLDGVAQMPLPGLQSAFDGIYPHGDHWYWRANYVREFPEDAVRKNVEHGSKLPTWKSTTHLYPVDGAAGRVDSAATAWAYRDARWVQVIVGVDPDPDLAREARDWAIAYSDAVRPYSMGAGYVNMIMEEGEDRVRASYGGNYERLSRIKATYDPDNVFHVNQTIRPT
jgi:FAD/FMN-containing dehydrogenase